MARDSVVFRIRELDPDMIAPSTKNMNKPDQGGSKIVIIGKPGCFIQGTKVGKLLEGIFKGQIVTNLQGEYVFGYDPIFVPDGAS
jgi:hypothetical protein